MPTLVIDNFKGDMTLYQNGDINSGKSFELNVAGYNPFVKPGCLTWGEAPIQIDPNGSVITDMIVAGKERVESGILYVYAIGHTGRLYKIQVNDPVTYDPDYDNPVLLATLTVDSPTFTMGGFIDFYGSTERIYIGHDKGVNRIDFNGTNEAAVGTSASWTQNVPRPFQQFVGNLYVGNGSNIAEVGVSATVTTYAKLSPAFPTNTQVRDIDLSPDGEYLEVVVTRLPLADITSSTQDVTTTSNSSSFVFKWNGVDVGYTSLVTYPSFSLGANTLFQNYQYRFGYDQFGLAVYDPSEKIISLGKANSPMPNAIMSSGNLLMWLAPLYYNGVLEIDMFAWGSIDFEVGGGYYDLMFMNATSPETDIICVPFLLPISNVGQGASSNGYANNIFGSSKVYFSTLETSSAPSTAYRLYKWTLPTIPNIPSGDIIQEAVYQTQTQLFSKKAEIKQVRIYSEGWVAGNSFQVNLIGSDRNTITNGSKVFTVGTNIESGQDYLWWDPDIAPTYALGIQIVNLGLTNHVINKIEIDYESGGK